eukprot:UN07899
MSCTNVQNFLCLKIEHTCILLLNKLGQQPLGVTIFKKAPSSPKSPLVFLFHENYALKRR